MNAPLLAVDNLSVSLKTKDGIFNIIDNISFSLNSGEILGLVGESGSGKSITSLAIIDLLPLNLFIQSGSIYFKNKNILDMTPDERRALKGAEIGMIFQDPLTALNPLMTVGMQVAENLIFHKNMNVKAALESAGKLLEKAGISDGKARVKSYPHQFSGGMRQRVMIAMALACSPDFLIADEPTTALDVTVQASVMKLIKNLCLTNGTALLLISHNLELVRHFCDSIAVMYAGQIVEKTSAQEIFSNPFHPYTSALMACLPSIYSDKKIKPIEGIPPSVFSRPTGCFFHPRCSKKLDLCINKMPQIIEHIPGHFVRCHLYDRK